MSGELELAGAAELTTPEHVERVRGAARELAGVLRDATDAGVPHGLILPQLILVFREVFGEMPAGFTLPAGLGAPQ